MSVQHLSAAIACRQGPTSAYGTLRHAVSIATESSRKAVRSALNCRRSRLETIATDSHRQVAKPTPTQSSIAHAKHCFYCVIKSCQPSLPSFLPSRVSGGPILRSTSIATYRWARPAAKPVLSVPIGRDGISLHLADGSAAARIRPITPKVYRQNARFALTWPEKFTVRFSANPCVVRVSTICLP